MNRIYAFVVPVLTIAFIATSGGAARGDEESIRKLVEAYVDAFNQQDIDSVAAMWTAKGSHTDRESGERTEGRDAIRADISAVFNERPETRLAGRIDRIRLIKPDVASVEGETTLVVSGEEPSVSVFSAIVVNTEGHWQIDSIEESPLPRPASSYDALSELDWLVGSWVDRGEGARVETTVSWTTNNAFLRRSFVTTTPEGVAQQGTQVIGWDPRSQEIRSWTFNSDGSFGDATWSKNGDEWLIKSSQTLANGHAASGTFVLSKIDDDTISLQLIGHEIEGEPQPSDDAVTVVRVVEQPDAPAKADAN